MFNWTMIGGAVFFLLSGLLLIFFPPKKKSHWYGYHTMRSSKSDDAWKFAQYYAGQQIIKSAIFIAIIGIICNLKVIQDIAFAIQMSSLALIALFIFYTTEKQLKCKF